MRYKANSESALSKIYSATAKLIKENNYDDITISEIIRVSGVSRSTFYFYFKTKDEILVKICDDLFNHIFASHLFKEKHHDYSKTNKDDYIHIITHSFDHFLEDKDVVLAILNSSGSKIFLTQLRNRLKPFIEKLITIKAIGNNDIPLDIKAHQYLNSYVSLLQYYLRHANDLAPEVISHYYLELSK